MQKIKICCFCETWESGGIESFLSNILQYINLEEIQVDIVVSCLKKSIFTEPLKQKGIRFFELSGSQRNFLKNHYMFMKLLRKENYNAVHLHIFHGLSLYYACLAKKAEAKDPELSGAIDCVLTFQELADMFHVFQTDFAAAEAELREHSSTAGRLYGRTGGVSKAVGDCVKSIQSDCVFTPETANGVQNCKALLEQILTGDVKGNFFEGMACDGGCAGGPKRVLDTGSCTERINQYADESPFPTPAENPYVADLMKRLGFHTVEDFVEHSKILTRQL